MNSPVRLGVSPAAASTPTSVFTQRFEVLFPRSGALGCVVCLAPPPFLPVYLCVNMGPQVLLAAALPAPFHNPPNRWVCQPLPCCESALPRLPVSALPISLDECFFFNSLVVGLPCGSIFCQLWCFLFLNYCGPSFGCARRHSVSTYTSIFSFSLYIVLLHL